MACASAAACGSRVIASATISRKALHPLADLCLEAEPLELVEHLSRPVESQQLRTASSYRWQRLVYVRQRTDCIGYCDQTALDVLTRLALVPR